ncbi:hypothetical protein BC830DRAFT_32158 [Chytriomyces sp. MP71]|nr:hypothetical protein BC830DRAFT_32158 [Chytriomyces sp. MP71]
MAQTHSSDDPEVADAQFEEADIVDAQGNVVTGGLTGDMKIRWVGLAAFIVLFCSWTTQWVAFALPYWKADKYHNAGLFTVCSHVEWEFVNVTRIYCPEKNDPNFATYQCFDPSIPGAFIETTQELQPGSPIEKCQSINDYVDDFKKLVCVPPYESQHYCFYAENSKRYIIRSRWFEAISTCLDMTFGITTLIFMIWPDKEPKKNVRNGIIALIGIFLTPWPTVIDLLLQTECE